jgi:hypothetical protein
MCVIFASRDPVLRFHGSVTLKEQAGDVYRRSLSIRYVESGGVKVHETWEREHKDRQTFRTCTQVRMLAKTVVKTW